MRVLNTDRFWSIMFKIPLPLILSTAAIGQGAAVELEPVIVSEPYPPPGLNLDTPSETGSRLGISIQQTPASVEIVDRPLSSCAPTALLPKRRRGRLASHTAIHRGIHRCFHFAALPITRSRSFTMAYASARQP